jgi:hypothetical protein
MGNVTVKESILIKASLESVWDFTQDYNRRTQWDHLVKHARVEQESPRKRDDSVDQHGIAGHQEPLLVLAAQALTRLAAAARIPKGNDKGKDHD